MYAWLIPTIFKPKEKRAADSSREARTLA